MISSILYKIHLVKIYFSQIITKLVLNRLNVKYGLNLNVLFQPVIVQHKNAQIILGDNVTLNSDKKYYHLGMFSNVKIVADKKESFIKIGDNTRINGACIHSFNKIEIGKNCLIAANTNIIDSNGHVLSMNKPSERIKSQDAGQPIIIEDNVWISTGCLILGGTKIGKGSVITANSVVKGDVPANCLFGGNPAKIIKQY